MRDFKGFSLAEVVANDGVQSALLWIKDRSPDLMRKIDGDIEKDAWRKAKEDERSEDDDYMWELREAGREKVLEHMLSYFEHGSALIHKRAPVALYYALSSLFNICPASLSRGLAVKLIRPEELPEGWHEMPEVRLTHLGEATV